MRYATILRVWAHGEKIWLIQTILRATGIDVHRVEGPMNILPNGPVRSYRCSEVCEYCRQNKQFLRAKKLFSKV